MTAHAKPLPSTAADMSLGTVLAALALHDDKALAIRYGGRLIGAGYHVTEVKAGSFVTLDCGGNPDAWQETILQVEDLPAGEGQSFMAVSKFRSILAKVADRIALNLDARLTVEVGPPGTPMQVYDVAAILIDGQQATLDLGSRSAICKPRHRAVQAEPPAACCAPSSGRRAGAVAEPVRNLYYNVVHHAIREGRKGFPHGNQEDDQHSPWRRTEPD